MKHCTARLFSMLFSSMCLMYTAQASDVTDVTIVMNTRVRLHREFDLQPPKSAYDANWAEKHNLCVSKKVDPDTSCVTYCAFYSERAGALDFVSATQDSTTERISASINADLGETCERDLNEEDALAIFGVLRDRYANTNQ